MSDAIEFFLPAPRFSWRAKGKKGKPKVTRESTHPVPKGNATKVITLGRGANRFSKIVQDERTEAAEEALTKALHLHPQCPPVPWECDVALSVAFVFEPSKSWPGWRKEEALKGTIRPTIAGFGDVGNLSKMFDDALEGAGFISDDAHIAETRLRKEFGPVPGFRVELRKLPMGPTSALEARGIKQGKIFK